MTEEEWTNGASAVQMLQYLRPLTSDRKLQLSACGFCRTVWPLLGRASRTAVELGEVRVDGVVEESRLETVLRAAIHSVLRFQNTRGVRYQAANIAYRVLCNDGWYSAEWTIGNSSFDTGITILRDIFGNPFRPVEFAPEWRTSTTVALAESMYAARDFGAMPVLADALEEAGCDHTDILAHCRDPAGVHVRGCWVVDLVLGKS